MGQNVTRKLIKNHLVHGEMIPGQEIGLRIDQTLTQDATGTMVMLELEAMNLSKVKTELSVQYVDHNLVQEDHKNPDDHLFLRSACERFGIWFSRPGNGVSHPLHMENFGIPGKTVLGSDSHTPAAGSLGMLGIGAGGLQVAMAMAGEPFFMQMPKILGVRLVGKLSDWVSAKDIILEMLRRHNVTGGIGKIIEYHGPGLKNLTAMDRHVVANMGAELGATSSVFPSDHGVRDFLKRQGREKAWKEIVADKNASYDEIEEMDLSQIEPLIACPSSPGNVVPVREVAGKEIYQSYIGSSANPGLRDFAIPALMVDGLNVSHRISFDINPASRKVLEEMIDMGVLKKLIRAGARIHQPGCNGCIGRGQAPATGSISLRTVPRNFPGRSGTKNDQVYLCSPETAAASALTGRITDPRTLNIDYPVFNEPGAAPPNMGTFIPPVSGGNKIEVKKGPNIKPLPLFDPMPENLKCPVLIKVGDNVSTDEILPAGSRVLPFRSNIPEISRFVFGQIDETYYTKALEYKNKGSFVVGGNNYGQGSSREHAVIAPRYLGVRAVCAKSFARIHRQNLISFGILPLIFHDPENWEKITSEDVLEISNISASLLSGENLGVHNLTTGETYTTCHQLNHRQAEIVLAGGLINLMREK
jgi:aconitate hydratase